MSTRLPDTDTIKRVMRQFAPGTGPDRYARFAEQMLGIERTWVLDQISEALDEHRQVIVMGGNGVGKSYDAAGLGVAALYCNPDTTVPITAGNGDTVRNSIWKPIKNFHQKNALPGRTLDNSRELKTGFDEKWYLQCLSPRHPQDLEGDHNETIVYVIEEAEKPGVTEEHIDSARSTITSKNDRILVLANPPTDEANIVNQLLESDEWHSLVIPSWESHNVRIDRGFDAGNKVNGLSTVWKLRQDWENYHDEEWPGLERAIEISSPFLDVDGTPTVSPRDGVEENPEFRDDLHERWYKRRAGIRPPDGSDTWRPWSLGDVKAAYNRPVEQTRETPSHVGIDVARGGGDRTIMTGLHHQEAVVHYSEPGCNHVDQRIELQDNIKGWADPEVNIDAVGEGSALADELDARVPNVNRFSNGEIAVDEHNYRFKWDEGLQLTGEWLRDGGSFSNSDLYEELKVAARVLKFKERQLKSRGGKIIEATPKEKLKEELGHSPDYLDSLLMAVWIRETDSSSGRLPLSI